MRWQRPAGVACVLLLWLAAAAALAEAPSQGHLDIVAGMQDAAPSRLSLQVPQSSLSQALHAVTANLIKAASGNRTLALSPLSANAHWWAHPGAGDACNLAHSGCVFAPLASAAAARKPVTLHEQWNDVAAADFFLKGAGLLWMWVLPQQRSVSSGCWMAAAFLGYAMRPSEVLKPLLDDVVTWLEDKAPDGGYACCTHTHGSTCKDAAALPSNAGLGDAALLDTQRLTRCEFEPAWCDQHWTRLGRVARKALVMHACAAVNASVVGSPEHTDAKVLTLLGFSQWGRLPRLYGAAGPSEVWADAQGFASCTSEELFKERSHAAAGRTTRWRMKAPRAGWAYRKVPPPPHGCAGCYPCAAPGALPNITLADAPVGGKGGGPFAAVSPFDDFAPPREQPHDFSTCASVDEVMAQTEPGHAGPVCCGHGHTSGVQHVRTHPQLQACRLVVLTFVGYRKDLLAQPALLHPNVTDPPAERVCFVALMDPESAHFHHVKPDLASSAPLPQLGQWTVVTMMNTPYWNKTDPHFSPRRVGKSVKFLGHRMFPSVRFMMWIDGKYSGLRHDPRLLMRWAFGGGTRVGLVTFAHPVRKDGWVELELEKGMPPRRRSADHLANLATVEGLFTRYGYPHGGGLLDSAMLLMHLTPETQRLLCLWWSMTHHTTARDQFLFEFLLWKMDYNGRGLHKRIKNKCLFTLAPRNGHLS